MYCRVYKATAVRIQGFSLRVAMELVIWCANTVDVLFIAGAATATTLGPL